MITIYKNLENKLLTVPEPSVGCWLNVIQPNSEEIARLIELGIPQDYITYSLDVDERSRTERENGELLILLRVPFFQGETVDIPYATIPLGIISTDKYLVTVCRRSSDIIQDLV